jgi:hypothetical protein
MKILKITTHWSAEEAECIYQLLDELKDAIWQSYGEDILKMHETIRLGKQDGDEHENFNDETRF